MLVGPGVEVKTVEGDAVRADWNDRDARPHFAVEAVLVHAEVGWGGAEADEAWGDGVGHGWLGGVVVYWVWMVSGIERGQSSKWALGTDVEAASATPGDATRGLFVLRDEVGRCWRSEGPQADELSAGRCARRLQISEFRDAAFLSAMMTEISCD